MNKLQYTLRNIKRNKLNTAITTIGLSMALASVLIIFLFITQENSYNSFHEKADRIYRLNYHVILKDGEEGDDHLVSPDLAEVLRDKVPQLANCTPFRIGGMAQLDLEESNRKINLGIAEQPFFDMFSFKLLYGNRDELLTNPTNIVLTESMAKSLLKDGSNNVEDLMGESFRFTFIRDVSFTVVGIMEDIPKNSSIDFEAIIPYHYEDNFWQSNNGFGNSTMFIELKDNVPFQQASAVVSNEVTSFYKQTIESGQKSNRLMASSNCFQPFMLPLGSLYLDESVQPSYEKSGNKAQLNILTVVGILILFIAVINYIILTIGQFFRKSGEVSIRKSIGGKNINILGMFLSENSILILVSFIVGAFLSFLLIPLFNAVSESQIYLNLINIPMLVLFCIGIVLLLISITSFTPLFVFRKVKPAMLATKKMFSSKKAGASQIFVGLQYTLTIVLIIATIVINKQTHFLKNKSLGFSDDNIISVDVHYLDQSKSAVLRDILKKQTGVLNAALTNRDFFDGYSSRTFKVSESEVLRTYTFKADENFIPTLGLEILEGRNFSETNISENDMSIIVNEEFVRNMEFKGSPIGKVVEGGQNFTIIGVVNDYQFKTSREKIEPMVLHSKTNMGNGYSTILVKYNPQNLSEVVGAIKEGWKEMETKETLIYTFWDQELGKRYVAEERLSKIIMLASIIAIVILTLGLFGLTVLISTQRTNEIGIRKVNGATASQVILLLNSDYLKWVFMAILIACPIAWNLLDKWLENFAFKTNLDWWIFALSGILTLAVALLTVTWHSWQAARRNPVEALRYE